MIIVMEKGVTSKRKVWGQARMGEESRDEGLRDSIRQGVARLKEMRKNSSESNKDKLRRSLGAMNRYTMVETDPN